MIPKASGRVGGLTVQAETGADRERPHSARYKLRVGDGEVVLNDVLGAGVHFEFLDELACVHCNAAVRKLYGGGYCYDCFSTLARCDLCVVSPDRCHYHAGTCREPDWGEAFCMQPHVVYLSNTSGPKVGITTAGRTLGRWLEQGAAAGCVVAAMPTRRAAGMVEAFFARTLSDRTDWRRMVTGRTQPADLLVLAERMRGQLPSFERLQSPVLRAEEVERMAWVDEPELVCFEYPVRGFSPAQRLPLSARAPEVSDNLQGVIGRYLLFSRGVINLSDYRGMGLNVSFGPPFESGALEESDQMSLFD